METYWHKSTLKLAATYLMVVMVVSALFSIILYNTTARHLEQRPQRATEVAYNMSAEDANAFMSEREAVGKQAILVDLGWLNIFVLIIGALLSYQLARATLTPIIDNAEAQAQFVSDASHELRTPLAALKTTNEVALRAKKLDAKEIREVLAGNVDEITRLNDLTNALLGLVVAEPVRKQPASYQRATAVAMSAVLPTALQKQISIEDETRGFKVMASTQVLAQIITILLDNAVKYSPDKTTITVQTKMHGKTGSVTVTDQGIGMPIEVCEQVFDRFYRADKSRARSKKNGYGLGLSIAKKLVSSYGGKISVVSTPGNGSSFTVTFPLA